MPSPFGPDRNAAQYYQYAATPGHYLYNWDGMPSGTVRPPQSGRGLSGGWTEVSEGADLLQDLGEDFLDIQAEVKLHRALGMTDYPVAMSMESGLRSVRHSGPEQTHLYDSKPLGFFGALSNNEKTLAFLALGAAAVFVSLKYLKPARRNGRRRRGRR